uniref:Alkenal reductase-like protein n=1 Tax=Gloriosa superba TaxID=41220 RepID=A0A7D5Q548_GLOSU|nr:alkenal reductase-like protein [Gloriosa superba]
MAEVVESRQWVMTAYAEEGLPTPEHVTLITTKVAVDAASIPEGHAAVQVLWISIDPYLRSGMLGRMDGLCFPPFPIGKVITTLGVGRIIRSKDASYCEGDIVLHTSVPVADYCIAPATMLRKIDMGTRISPLDYLTAFGLPGFAAWIAIHLIGNPKPGENVFISAAAGAVGMLAGQLAKLKGCRVVGSTGTDEKVNLLKEEFKFDDAFNYKKEADFDAALSKYLPSGIDIYVDNVGGKMLEAVLNHVNKKARIPLCGMISQYNQVWTERDGVRNLLNMIGKEVRMEGFIITSYLQQFQDFEQEIGEYLNEGKLVSKVKIVEGIEGFLESLLSLFSSSNVGKVILQVNK